MPLGTASRRNEPLYVGWMALALVLAAALGGAAGVIWQWVGFGSDVAAEPAAKE